MARRLRRLQQAVQEEVSRYGLDAADDPMTPLEPSQRPTPGPSPFRTREQGASRGRPVEAAVQTDPVPQVPPVPPWRDPYVRFQGPFVMSEHGDRVHFDPQCYGLRHATTRRRQVTLCHYCERRQSLYRLDDWQSSL